MANRNYEPSTSNTEAPLEILNNPLDTGYFVTKPNRSAQNSQTWNGILITTDQQEFKLWIEDLVLNFSMSGSYGQSRYRKQFYPKAFNQPMMRVRGTMPNQYEYNKLAAFIREGHFDALNQTNRKTVEGNSVPKFDKKTLTFRIKDAGDKTPPKRNLKGGHLPLAFEGYIKNIRAGAKKFEFAPSFEFEFVVAGSKDTGSVGIYQDDVVQGNRILSWLDVFKQNHFSGSARQPTDPNSASAQETPTVSPEETNPILNPFADPLGPLKAPIK